MFEENGFAKLEDCATDIKVEEIDIVEEYSHYLEQNPNLYEQYISQELVKLYDVLDY